MDVNWIHLAQDRVQCHVLVVFWFRKCVEFLDKLSDY